MAPTVGAADNSKKRNEIKGWPSAIQPSDLRCSHRSDTIKGAIFKKSTSVATR